MSETSTKKIGSHFLNLFQLALSDTTLHPDELKFLYDIGIKKGVEKKEIDVLIENPHKIRFYEPTSVYEKVEQLYEFAHMILADGRVDPREIAFLKNLVIRFGFEDENASDIVEFLIEESKVGSSLDKILKIVRNNY